MHAVVLIDAVLQLQAECLIELLVFLPIVLHHTLEFILNGTLDAPCDLAKLCVVLEHFSGNVQGQIFGVHQTLDKAEIIRQQIFAAIHDQHTVGIQLQALFVVLAVVVERSMGRDIQQGIISNSTFVPHMHMAQRIRIIAALIFIETVVFFFADLILVLMPQRHHAVQCDIFHIFLVLVGILFLPALGHVHTDREANIIAVPLYQTLNSVLVEEFAVVFAAVALCICCHIVQQFQCDLRTHGILLAGIHGVALYALGLPYIRLLFAECQRLDCNTLGNHECGIEADTELPDDLVIFCQIVLFLELERAAVGDRAQMLLHFRLGHADTVIGNGQGASILVHSQCDLEVGLVHAHAVVRQRLEIQLINGIAGVGDQFAEKDLLMGIDRMDHHVHQFFGFCLKLFLFHLFLFAPESLSAPRHISFLVKINCKNAKLALLLFKC